MTENIKHKTDHRSEAIGYDISKYDITFIQNTLQKRFVATQCEFEKEYLELVSKDKVEAAIFIDSLHNCYSEFFRNPLTFSVLEQIIFPALMLKIREKQKKEIRIWSAACASGQEVYSLAMVLEELKINGSNNNHYRIFATDLEQSQLNFAQSGEYDEFSLNKLYLRRLNQWFTKSGGKFKIKPELKKNINFSVFDLFNDKLTCPAVSIYGDFDMVFCANLLFYYKPEYRKIIIEKITKCLASDGYVITGEAEREIFLNLGFKEVFPMSGIFKK